MVGTRMTLFRQGGASLDYTDLKIDVTQEYLDLNRGLLVYLNSEYEPGTNQLEVYYNGQRLTVGGGYEEIDSTSIKLNLGLYPDGTPVGLRIGDEIFIRNWRNRYVGGGGVSDNLLIKLNDEIVKARQYKETDIPYPSLDDRIDKIQDSLSKVLVFVIPYKQFIGVQKIELKFPFSGEITDVYASCRIPGTGQTIIDVEKISQIDYDTQVDGWESIFLTPLSIDANKKSSNNSEISYVLKNKIVNINDYFRLNLIQVGEGLEDLTVSVVIQI